MVLLLTLTMPIQAAEWCILYNCVSQGPNGCAGSNLICNDYGTPEEACGSLGGIQIGGACHDPNTNATLGSLSLELDSGVNADPGKNVNIADANPDCGIPVGGNPINFSLGIKSQQEIDLAPLLSNGLNFIRNYNSHDADIGSDTGMGFGWSNTYSRHLSIELLNVGSYVYLVNAHREDGRSLSYSVTSSGGSISSDDDQNRIERILDAQQVITGWRLIQLNGITEEYDTNGKLLKITNRIGHTQSLQYDVDSDPQTLDKVTGPFGRTLTFTYDAQGRIQTLSDPAGALYQYAYGANGNLVAVTYPDETPGNSSDNPVRQYHYENVNFPHALTGITDENGNRYATWNYDANGRAYTSEHANGVEHVSLEFDGLNNSTTVTDAHGHVNTYYYTTQNGVSKIDHITGEKGYTCGKYQTFIYEAHGNPSHRTDFNGNLVTNNYDFYGMETQRVEGGKRRINTDYFHSTFRDLPGRVRISNAETGQLLSSTSIDYTTLGQLSSIRQFDLLDNSQITTSFTYDPTTQFVRTINGPRTDVNDITTFDYDVEGNLIKTTNALGQETNITAHNAHGQPLTIVDANNTITTLTYDARRRLLTRTVDGQTTSFEYDGVGNITKTTLPNGSFLMNEYDAAQRLIAVEDNLGNRIEYTLDSLGNRIQEDVKDPLGTLTRTMNRTYNSLNRLIETLGGENQSTTFGYDANGNQTNITVDPTGLNQQTIQAFDAINRLETITDAKNGLTTYVYDARDNLTSVTDANGLTTTYNYDSLNNLIQQDSPDTGITTFTYDTAGNRLTQTDARGVITTYTYDALNRLLTLSYPDVNGQPNPQNVTYLYDVCTNGVGRLCRMIDESGIADYSYDVRGNLVTQTTTLDGYAKTTSYAYNGADQLIQMTYPSGRIIDYIRNVLGQIESVTTTQNNVSETLSSTQDYEPFGSMDSMVYGNNLVHSRSYDMDYRLSELLTVNGNTHQNLIYDYDAANNITGITDSVNTASSQVLGYDELNRLTDAIGLYGDLNYTHDEVGNRLSETQDTVIETYSYDVNSHHLSQTDNGVTVSYNYDANGNTTSNTNYDFVYGDNNRLKEVQVLGSPIATYTYNGRGERSKKVAQDTTYFLYDQTGLLISELDSNGDVQVEYVYLNGQPLAMMTGGSSGGNTNNDPQEQIIDNQDTGFSVTGTWTESTVVSGFHGSNYQHHFANGPSPEGIVIDNTDPSFSVTGKWLTSTAVSGYEGNNYQHHFSNGPSPDAIQVDNEDTGFSVVGTWNTSTSTLGYIGNNYQPNAAGTGEDVATWTITIPTTGDYDVYARWTSHANRASNAKYMITHSDGIGGTTTTTTVTVNQRQNGGQDNLLGTFAFDVGTATISLSDDADGYVIADAITVAPPNAAPNTAIWSVDVPEEGQYEVYAKWTAHPNRATNASYTIYHANGTDTVNINQQTGGGVYNLLGVFTFSQGTGQKVELSDQADGYVIADAIQIVPVGATPNTATWKPNITQAAEYEIFANWTGHPNRATDAKYTINHAEGSSEVNVNQQVNGGIFNSLGTFTLDQNSDIELTDVANGYVIADAIKIVRTDTPSTVSSATYFYHVDHLGTPQQITDATQSIVWKADYSPFGEANIITQLITNNLRFPGQYYDEETGLYYNYHRYYDPSIGRYITSDPMGLYAGVNTYTYVGGNPIYYVDPFGLRVYMAEKSIGGDPTGIGGHTWVILESDHPEELPGLPLDPNGRLALRAGPDGPGYDKWAHGAHLVAQVGGDSTTKWRQLYDIPTPEYLDCESVSDDTRHIRAIIDAYNSFIKNQQGKLPYSGLADTLDGVEQYNSNSFTAAILGAAGNNVPDPWGYQPGIDKPVPLR